MRTLLVSMLIAALLGSQAAASTHCDFSGDDWEASSTRLSVVLEIDGHKQELHFSSLYFMFRFFNELQADGRTLGALEQFSMLDYRTYDTNRERFLEGSGQTKPTGYFLWTNHELPGSAFPYIAAYSDPQAARAAMDQWGGEILDGEEMLLDLFGFFVNRHGLVSESTAAPAAKPHGGAHH
jgi:hypothetical protein